MFKAILAWNIKFGSAHIIFIKVKAKWWAGLVSVDFPLPCCSIAADIYPVQGIHSGCK